MVRTPRPSSTRPAARGSLNACLMMPMMTASGTRSPRSMYPLASRPSAVPARMAARSSSPVERVGTPSAAASSGAWVPFPAPGFPKSTMIMSNGEGSESRGSRLLASADLQLALLHEAVVLPQQKMLLHLRQRIERDTDHDEQRRSAERHGLRHVHRPGDGYRQQRDGRQEQRPRQRDARHHLVDVLRGLRTRLHARNE